tara:strand:+ start:901 stop:1140 length:240 start_codon:yes stop_codon:yes gene_type:complete
VGAAPTGGSTGKAGENALSAYCVKLSDQLGKAASQAGFVGYLLADHQGKQVTVQADRPACHIQVMIPQIASKPSAPATQ